MKRLQFLLISILIGVLVGCDADPGKEFDWCYTYEFTGDDFDATIGSGTWESGKGFVTTGGVGGSLSFEVFHPTTVEPSRISMDLYLNRSEITPVSIPFSAFFNVFGIESTVSDNVPAIIGIQNITVDSSFGGQIGTSARIIVTTDAEVEVARLTVSGLGFNPFPSSDCARVTPTPTNIMLPTATASTTPTITSTPSPTLTLTPSPTTTLTPTITPTVVGNWCKVWDVSTGFSDWNILYGSVSTNGVHHTYVGSTVANGTSVRFHGAALEIVLPSGSNPNYAHAEMFIQSGKYDNTGFIYILRDGRNLYMYTPDLGHSQIAQLTSSLYGSSAFSNRPDSVTITGSLNNTISIMHHSTVRSGAVPTVTGVGWIESVELRGNGINPFGTNDCPDPTSTPSVSPTPSITPTASNTPVITDTPGPTNTPVPASSTPMPTATATGTAIPTRTPFPTPMILPTSTPDPEDDGNEFGSSGTCTNYGGTEPSAESNGEWTEWLFGGVSNLVECVIMPPINWIGDLVNSGLQMLGNLYDFAVYGVQSFIQSVNWFGGQFIPWALGSLANFFAVLWWGLGALINGIFGLLQLIWDTVVAFVNALVSFISTAWSFIIAGITNAQQLVDLWNNAPATKPPGLPDCVASPTDSDLCALYYVSQNTMLAGIGVIIVPLLTIAVNLIIVGTFIDRIKIFISGLQDVLKQ